MIRYEDLRADTLGTMRRIYSRSVSLWTNMS